MATHPIVTFGIMLPDGLGQKAQTQLLSHRGHAAHDSGDESGLEQVDGFLKKLNILLQV